MTFSTLRVAHRAGVFAAALSLVAVSAFAGPACADGTSMAVAAPDDAARVVLTYDRQSLGSEAGAQALYRRIARAAEQVCPAAPGDLHLLNPATRACRSQAIARAVQSIDSPRLAALHAASTKPI